MLKGTVDVKTLGMDQNGRALAEVFVDGHNVNLEMLKAGLAEAYCGRPASGHEMDSYWKTEGVAKAAKREMWVLGESYVSPREWRKRHAQ